MRRTIVSLGAIGGLLLFTQVAEAHLLSCEKTVNGTTNLEVSTYPTTLHYVLTVNNASPDFSSDVLTASDPILESMGFSFTPAPPFSLAVGESASSSYDVVLKTADDCIALAAEDGIVDDRIDNVFTTSWESGSAECTASVTCIVPPKPPSGATRTMGFYKTHEEALSACLDAATSPMLASTLDLSSALGYLWGSPAAYDTGEKRSDIDRARFLLARQLLTAECNVALFGTPTVPGDLLSLALAALQGTDCELMIELQGALDTYNNSGDSVSFPSTFEPGPATPKDASSLADDPTSPSGDQCG